jgi:hypothetical protein
MHGILDVTFWHNVHFTMKISPFELALKVKTRQPMNLTILNMGGDYHERGKNVKEMVRERKEIKTQAKKLLGRHGQVMKNKPIRFANILNSRLMTFCGLTFQILRCPKPWQVGSY